MMRKLHLLVACALCACMVSCSDEPEPAAPDVPAMLTFAESSDVTLIGGQSDAVFSFDCNCDWEILIPEDSRWLTASPMSGKAVGGTIESFEVHLTADPSVSGPKSATIKIKYGDKAAKFTVTKLSFPPCSQFEVSDDMVFSTTLGRNSNNVAQGFDYDPDDDLVYITQKYGTYRIQIGWQKREKASSETVASNYMTLSCFSHGNNISIQKMPDGSRYVWAPNYGTRQDDGSYDNPKVLSRFPLENGKTINNTATTENYYFGLKVTWPAFDFKNDLMAVCDYEYFYIYRISDIMALPEETLTLDYSITYGGSSPVDTKREEWTGYPVVKARDCRKAKMVYKVPFTYKKRNLHWQSYCIDNGWIFAILSADKKSAPAIIYDTYVEAYKMDGTDNLYKIRQEYIQNRDAIVPYGWTEADYYYCEPEGIKVYDGVLLTMYTIRGDKQRIRRPVIFRLSSPVQ